jgi:hypothetical protein
MEATYDTAQLLAKLGEDDENRTRANVRVAKEARKTDLGSLACGLIAV